MAWLILCLCCSDFGFPCVLRLMRSRVASSNSRHCLLCFWLSIVYFRRYNACSLYINIVLVLKVSSIVEIFFCAWSGQKNICPVTMRFIIRLPFLQNSQAGNTCEPLKIQGGRAEAYQQTIAFNTFIRWAYFLCLTRPLCEKCTVYIVPLHELRYGYEAFYEGSIVVKT